MGYSRLGIVSMPPDISQHHVTSISTILYWHFGNTVVLGTFYFYLLFLFLSAESPFTHEHYSVIVWTEHTTVQNTNKTDNKFIQKWVRHNEWKILSDIPPFFREGSVIFVFPLKQRCQMWLFLIPTCSGVATTPTTVEEQLKQKRIVILPKTICMLTFKCPLLATMGQQWQWQWWTKWTHHLHLNNICGQTIIFSSNHTEQQMTTTCQVTFSPVVLKGLKSK